MNKILVLQISLLVVFGSGLGYLMLYTDVYNEVQQNIVSTVCLSCIKMYPVPTFEFIFDTQNDQMHPNFVLDNLSKGPVFLTYRKDVCDGCEEMDPLIQEVFDVNFGLYDYESYVDFEDTTIYFRHINIEHTTSEFEDSYEIYGGVGVPMFVVITLGNNSGTIEPCYRVEYGTLGLEKDFARKEFIKTMMHEAIEYYNQNGRDYS